MFIDGIETPDWLVEERPTLPDFSGMRSPALPETSPMDRRQLCRSIVKDMPFVVLMLNRRTLHYTDPVSPIQIIRDPRPYLTHVKMSIPIKGNRGQRGQDHIDMYRRVVMVRGCAARFLLVCLWSSDDKVMRSMVLVPLDPSQSVSQQIRTLIEAFVMRAVNAHKRTDFANILNVRYTTLEPNVQVYKSEASVIPAIYVGTESYICNHYEDSLRYSSSAHPQWFVDDCNTHAILCAADEDKRVDDASVVHHNSLFSVIEKINIFVHELDLLRDDTVHIWPRGYMEGKLVMIRLWIESMQFWPGAGSSANQMRIADMMSYY